MTPDLFQTIIVGLLSGGLVGGIFSLISKRSKSPESQNELAKVGNEFASQLLLEARAERKELRDSIIELQKANVSKEESIAKLKELLAEKDKRIAILEKRQQTIADKLKNKQLISLVDIFGEDAPDLKIVIADESAATTP